MNINLEHYKTFYTVVKTGSISAAANALFVSQPAVTKIIKQLEKSLDANLFVRSSKGVRLTPEGERLYGFVSRGYEYFLSAEQAFTNIKKLDEGEVRIGASDMALKYYLLPHLEYFHRSYPGVKISVVNGPTPETIKSLRAGAVDLGVVTAPVYSDRHMDALRIGSVRDCFVTDSPELAASAVTPADLSEMPLVMLEKNTSARRYADAWFDKHDITLEPEFELGTSELIVQFALRGMGVGCVVEDYIRDHLKKSELFEIKLTEPIPERGMFLITSVKTPIPPAGRKLIELLKNPQGHIPGDV